MTFLDKRIKQIFSSLSAKDRTAVEALISEAMSENNPDAEIDARAKTYIQGALKLSRPAQKAALELGFISGDLYDIPYEEMIIASKSTPFERDAKKLFLEYGSAALLSYRYDNDNSKIENGDKNPYFEVIKPLLTEENLRAAAIKDPFSYIHFNSDKKLLPLDWSKYSTQDLILAVERSSTDAIIDSYPSFRDRPDVQQILDATFKIDPMYGFEHPELQKSNPDLYKGFMAQALKEDPKLFFTELNTFNDPLLLNDSKKIISSLPQSQRDDIFKSLEPNELEIVLGSLSKNYRDNLIPLSDARSIIDAAIHNPKISNSILAFAGLYRLDEFKDIFKSPQNQNALLDNAIKKPEYSVMDIGAMRELPFYEGLVKYIVDKKPNEAFHVLDRFQGRADFPQIIDKLTQSIPIDMYRHAYYNDDLNQDQRKYMLEKAADSLPKYLEANPRSSILVTKILNDLHEEPDSIRYNILAKLDATNMARLIANSGGLEDGGMFTSTFNHVYNQMKVKASQEGTTVFDIINKKGFSEEEAKQFLDTIGSFGKSKDIISSLSADYKLGLANYIMDDLASDVDRAPAALRLIEGFPKNDPSLAALEGRIISGFLEAKENDEDRDRDAYGLVARAYVEKLGFTPSADNKKFFDQILQEKRYQLFDVDKTLVNNLLDSSKRNFQVHVFYNDDDGQLNYDLYNKMMKAQGWKSDTIDNKFTHFQKTENGRAVHIYANIPDKNLGEKDIEESTDAIFKDIKDVQKGTVSVVVHRGHSYFVDETIKLIPPETKVVFLGACNGTSYFDDVLEHAPKSAIISTQGVGTRAVNDPIIRDINKSIFNQSNIDWNKVQQMVDKIPNENALYYKMPPRSFDGYFLHDLDSLENESSPKLSGTYLGNQFASAAQATTELTIPTANSPTVTNRNQSLALASPS